MTLCYVTFTYNDHTSVHDTSDGLLHKRQSVHRQYHASFCFVQYLAKIHFDFDIRAGFIVLYGNNFAAADGFCQP